LLSRAKVFAYLFINLYIFYDMKIKD